MAVMALSAVMVVGASMFENYISDSSAPYIVYQSDEDDTEELKTTVTALVCGIDSAVSLSDVIMLTSYDKSDNSLSVLQIPRDTYVGGERGTGKINSIYNSYAEHSDGINALKETVETMLPINIDYTALVDINSFVEIVDELGGIEIEIPYQIDYLPGQTLYPGLQTINGTQAEWLIRYREGYATGDIGRLDMQRYFLSAVYDNVKAKSMTELMALLPTALKYIETDIPLPLLVEIAPSATQMGMENIKIDKLAGDGVYYLGQAVYQIDAEKSAEVLNELFGSEDISFTASDINIFTTN